MDTVKTWIATGLTHRSRGLACQDWVCTRTHGPVQVIALADGTGDSDLGALGAQTAAETVAELLAGHYEELYALDEKNLRYTCLMAIRQALYAQCRQWQAEIGELGSTCLAVARHQELGTWLALHLGDGYVVIQSQGETRLLSGPENGINRDYTVLTTSNPAAPHMRLYRGMAKDTEGFCLLSDGWSKEEPDLARMLELAARALENSAVDFVHTDDLGAVAMGDFAHRKKTGKGRELSRRTP